MKHLILGSEGQIGRHLVNYFKKIDEEFIEFDIRRTTTEDLRIYDNELLIKEIKECDIVHFLAFDVGGSEYMKKYQDSYDFIANNIKIMNTVFDALKHYNKPFIFASSQMSNMLHSTYGILKAVGESYTRALNGVIVKFWNVYGYENDPEKTHVITDFIEMAKNEGKITMKTDGQEERQFLYGDDCAECLLILSKMYDEIDRGKALHITSFEWTKIIDIANIISSEFNNCPIRPSTKKDNVQRDIKNEPDEYILKFWKTKTKLKKGIKSIIDMMM
jgi:nucleoside-diphosphate-sugar epimerase